MKISAITVTQHRLRFAPPFRAAWDSHPRHHWDATIVRVETDEGLVGIGSGDLMLGFAGHEHLFLGQDPMASERHYRTLSHLSFHYGRCWPLDLALWDLAGKITGQPCWRLLGGLSDPCAMAEVAERYLGEGFPAMKLRFQRGDWRDDVAALEAIRARVGDRLELMVDCNQGWRLPQDTYPPWTLKDALRVARELERLDVYWMEEPLHRGDREGMKRLRGMTDLRVAGGEMTRELYEFRDLIGDGALDVLQPDAALVGGITGLRRVALMAQEHNLVFTPHTWGNGIGLLANAHLTAGVADAPFLEFPYDPPEWSHDRRDYMLAEPCVVDEAGWIVLSEAPGLGIALDEARLAATRIA